ncbi:hypothetical protein LguiA_007565 [Lonicera macranthoides]
MANSEANKLSYAEYRVKGLDSVKMAKKVSKRVMAIEKLCMELEEQVVEDKGKEIDLMEEAIQVKKTIQEDEKLEIDFQLMKDDKRRLEEELSDIKRSGDSSRLLFEGTSRTHTFNVDIFMDAMPL